MRLSKTLPKTLKIFIKRVLSIVPSVLLLLCASAPHAFAFYSPSDNVVELTPSNFDRLVINDDSIWIVEFYAPWCGHCQSLVPEYKKLASALKGVVKVGSVNADEHKSLGGQYGVRGFPTIKIFGANKRSPTDYSGQRTAKPMAEAGLAEAKKKVQAALGGGSGGSSSSSGGSDGAVIELTDDNFDKLVLQSEDVWLVEFFAPWCGHCKNLEPEWAKAAKELKGKVKLGALDATAHQSKAAVSKSIRFLKEKSVDCGFSFKNFSNKFKFLKYISLLSRNTTYVAIRQLNSFQAVRKVQVMPKNLMVDARPLTLFHGLWKNMSIAFQHQNLLKLSMRKHSIKPVKVNHFVLSLYCHIYWIVMQNAVKHSLVHFLRWATNTRKNFGVGLGLKVALSYHLKNHWKLADLVIPPWL